jgi:TM2 domain-containing membrane protein YozV
VSDGTAAQQQPPPINLKDPVMAAFLAWLIPGLGHLYQGRIAKAILFFVCIMGIYVYGIYLGGNSELGYGRAVYFAFRDDDWRLNYICQIGVGLPSLPALVQAMRMSNGKEVFFNGFMAPPRQLNMLDENNPNIHQPTLDKILRDLNLYFELGTFFTMVAGLLNVLAIYDAGCGPVVSIPAKKEERPDKSEKTEKS